MVNIFLHGDSLIKAYFYHEVKEKVMYNNSWKIKDEFRRHVTVSNLKGYDLLPSNVITTKETTVFRLLGS